MSEFSEYFENEELEYWKMQNGYALASETGLEALTMRINEKNEEEYEYLKGLLKIGIQKDTQVTIADRLQKVTQVYCSALPVGYSSVDAGKWETFARLILDGLYEATLLAAIENRERTGNPKTYLTLVGGGAFGNPAEWIIDAVVKNLRKYEHSGLEVTFVSYGQPSSVVRRVMEKMEVKAL